MKIQNKNFSNLLLFMSMIIVTLLLNSRVISYNFFYFEQPLMYIANQHALTFKDLLFQYTHPKFLHLYIPFFRPSGHFLIYYLLIPLFGWHNQQALFVINFIFLGIAGFVIIIL